MILMAEPFIPWPIGLIGIVFSAYMIWRNVKVLVFRAKILEAIKPANWSEAKKLYEKHSYNGMLFSTKPLKFEAWFTEEEIKILKGESDGN